MNIASRYHCSGLSLINLLMTLSILSILLGLGIPSLSHLLESNKKRLVISELMLMLNLARDSAVGFSKSVVICPTNDSQQCQKDWNAPLMVFVDFNENHIFDGSDRLLQIFRPCKENQSLDIRMSGPRYYLSYDALGTTGNQNGRIYFCNKSAKEPNDRVQIIFYRTGRARIPAMKEYKPGC